MRFTAQLLSLSAATLLLVNTATSQCTGQGQGSCNLAFEGVPSEFSYPTLESIYGY